MSTRTNATSRGLRPIQHAATNPFRFGAIRSVFAVFFTVVLFVGSTGAFVYHSLAAQVRDAALDISRFTAAQSGGEAVEPTPIDQFNGRAITLLVSGVDSRYNQDDAGYGSAEELSTIQSDTTMVAHISADRSTVTVISIPRDLITLIPPCLTQNGSSYAYEGMFNSAFSTGAVTNDLAGGVACTKATVEEMTGLTIDAFVVVDFAGFKGMIDALGGVWFDVPEPMQDYYSGLNVDAGCQKFDAYTALAFARARHDVGDGSDISRIGRQQQLVSAMLREVLSKNFVTDLPALLSFLQAAIGSLTVSPNLSDIRGDAGLLLSLLNIDKANIRFVTLPWSPSPADPNRVLAVEPNASRLWAALANDAPLPIGTEYTDGNGVTQIVPDPALQATTTEQSGDEPGAAEAPADPSTAPAPAVPAPETAPVPQTCPPTQ